MHRNKKHSAGCEEGLITHDSLLYIAKEIEGLVEHDGVEREIGNEEIHVRGEEPRVCIDAMGGALYRLFEIDAHILGERAWVETIAEQSFATAHIEELPSRFELECITREDTVPGELAGAREPRPVTGRVLSVPASAASNLIQSEPEGSRLTHTWHSHWSSVGPTGQRCKSCNPVARQMLGVSVRRPMASFPRGYDAFSLQRARTYQFVTRPMTERVPLTVVIPTRNEAHQIADVLASVEWADEVLVIDGGSTDETACIAAKHGATVLHHQGGTIAAQRNAGIDHARNEWILALDADERPSDDLITEIAAVISAPQHDAYRIQFHNFYGDRELVRGHWAREWHVRLFRRRYRFLDRQVHERLEDVSSAGTLRGFIRHASYRDFEHHLRKVIQYAQLGAEGLRARGYRVTVWHLLAKPAWRFLREYFMYGSYRDGRFGVVTSAMSALAAFLKYAFVAMPDLVRRRSGKHSK